MCKSVAYREQNYLGDGWVEEACGADRDRLQILGEYSVGALGMSGVEDTVAGRFSMGAKQVPVSGCEPSATLCPAHTSKKHPYNPAR